jgi:hypothetical protein
MEFEENGAREGFGQSGAADPAGSGMLFLVESTVAAFVDAAVSKVKIKLSLIKAAVCIGRLKS